MVSSVFIGRICYSRNATQTGFVYIPGVSTINRKSVGKSPELEVQESNS